MCLLYRKLSNVSNLQKMTDLEQIIKWSLVLQPMHYISMHEQALDSNIILYLDLKVNKESMENLGF